MASKQATPRGSPKPATDQVAGIGSSAVEAKTGKTWDEWLKLLDKVGARKMEHKAIATLLRDEHGLSGWWAQMVTVGYEQQRLGREKHQKPGGYEVSASKTIGVSLATLYRAWSDKRTRQRWLEEADFEIRKATRDKSMRITWVDGVTHVDANFYAKGDAKSQIAVQHKKIGDAKSAARIKKAWAERLVKLKTMLEAR